MKPNASTTVTLTLSELYLLRALLDSYHVEDNLYEKIEQATIALEDSMEFNKEDKY